MAFTEKKPNNFGFSEVTLNDTVVEFVNDTSAALKHNELVIINGFFGNVLNHEGGAVGAKVNIDINSDRTFITNQIAEDAAFVEGSLAYFVAGVLTSDAGEGNPAVGVVVGTDYTISNPATYVVIRPLVQGVA